MAQQKNPYDLTQDPIDLKDSHSPKRNKFKKLIFVLVLLIAGSIFSIRIWTDYMMDVKKQRPFSERKKNLYISDPKADKILLKLMGKMNWNDRNWIYFFITQLEKSSLEKGISEKFLSQLKKAYLHLESPGRWLAFCQNLDQKYFYEMEAKILDKIKAEEESGPKGTLIYISLFSNLWKEKALALFCAESLFRSENWGQFLQIDGTLTSTLPINTPLPGDWYEFRIISHNKTQNPGIAADICRKNFLTIKLKPKMLEACAESYTQLNNNEEAKKYLTLAFDLSGDRKYLIQYSRILLKEGKKEQAANMLLTLPK